MKFLPYLGVLISFLLGYLGYPFLFVFVVAIASTLFLFAPRRRQLLEQPQAPDRNMILDGAFLIAQQTILHFVFFALGIFILRMTSGG